MSPTARALLGVTLMAGLGCATPSPAPRQLPPPDQLSVHIEPTPDLRTLAVRLCGDPLPRRLVPGRATALAWTHDLRTDAGVELSVRDGGVDLPPATRCVTYTVDLSMARERASEGGVVQSAPGQWMWRPATLPPPETLRATLTADLGPLDMALPWPRLPDRGGHRAWSIPWGGLRYGTHCVIGRFERSALPVPGSTLRVVWIGRPQGDRGRFERWLTAAAGDVATVFGRFPVPEAQVIVAFDAGDDVGFGATARGGGPSAILFVGQRASAGTLSADWTATHELFHLGMPPIDRRDAWLSEGVTTVYTYLAMGRSGRYTPVEVREELEAGFARGRGWSTGRSLRADSTTLHENRAWWRVYWGGGAWALERAVTTAGTGGDFDAVLRLWASAATDRGRLWRARALLEWADRALPGHRLRATADAALEARAFPDTDALIRSLADPGIGRRLLEPRPLTPAR